MSSVSSSLSSGLQVLSNDGLLPSNLSAQQLQNASPEELTQISIDNVELSAVSSLFGEATSSSDSGSLDEDLANTLLGGSTASNGDATDPILEALETAMTNASSAVSTTGTTGSSTVSAPTDTSSGNVGTLFNYLG